MRSGNGRHRRPRQAPAVFVTAGVAGAGIAIPLLGATGAHAADAATWDRVARCESGGMWSADTGNGYYGGLQFTQETWERAGGRDYAPRADLASRSQQITIAEKVLADKGPEAWPSCATDAGLSKDGEPADVNPGSLDLGLDLPDPDPDEGGTPDPHSSPSGGGSREDKDAGEGAGDRGDTGTGSDHGRPDGGESDSGDADGTGSPSPAPDDSGAPRGTTGGSGAHRGGHDAGEATPDETPDPSASSQAGRHRGEPAPDAGHGTSRESGRHASRERHADAKPWPADGDYQVRPGDNLSAIAARHALPGGWQELYDANKGVVGGDPDLILPGQRLVLDDSER